MASLTPVLQYGGCSDKEYCSLNFSDEACTVSLDETKILYGVCTPFNHSYDSCKKEIVESSVQVLKACNEGEYCSLNFSDESCSSGLQETKTMYGVCSPSDNYYTACKKGISPSEMSVLNKCPRDMFCLLIWQNEKCETLQGDAAVIYGACVFPDESSAAYCPS